MVRVSVLLLLAVLCIAASAKPNGDGNGEKPENGGGNKPEKPEKPNKPGNGGKPENGGGNKPEKPNKPNKPEKPNKPNKPEKPEKPNKPNKPEKPNKPNGNGGGKPNGNGGGNKPNKPVKCNITTNFPCSLFGQECVEGDKGPSCEKLETTMTVMPVCDPECSPGCYCIWGQCFCPADLMGGTDLSMDVMWKMMSCASEAVGSVKSKACKKDCMMEDSDLDSCSTCVLSTTECLAGVAP